MVTQDVGDSRLMELADIVEKARYYNQMQIWRGPGGDHAPSCAIGYWMAHRGFDIWTSKAMTNRFDGLYEYAMQEFHLMHQEAWAMFGTSGCRDAYRDNHKAAAYIREFVAKRNPIKEVGDEGLPGSGKSAKQDACVAV